MELILLLLSCLFDLVILISIIGMLDDGDYFLVLIAVVFLVGFSIFDFGMFFGFNHNENILTEQGRIYLLNNNNNEIKILKHKTDSNILDGQEETYHIKDEILKLKIYEIKPFTEVEVFYTEWTISKMGWSTDKELYDIREYKPKQQICEPEKE